MNFLFNLERIDIVLLPRAYFIVTLYKIDELHLNVLIAIDMDINFSMQQL